MLNELINESEGKYLRLRLLLYCFVARDKYSGTANKNSFKNQSWAIAVFLDLKVLLFLKVVFI